MTKHLQQMIDKAIARLQSFEPPEGYFVAFSGGKDSIVLKKLCDLAGVKYDAHYAVTSVDPPELVYYIREHHSDVVFDIPHDKDGKPVNMWNLIASHTMPPTRKVRYCCEQLKECHGKERVTLTGVRWAESPRRKAAHGLVDFMNKPVNTQKTAEKLGVQYKLHKNGNVILNDDNDEARRLVEQCYRTRKTIINPIVEWTDEDVWDFIHEYNLPYCKLYDEGFSRIGCIGCPLAGGENMKREFERWPQYKELYIKAFHRMIVNHPEKEYAYFADPEDYEKEILDDLLAERERERDGCAVFAHWLYLGAM